MKARYLGMVVGGCGALLNSIAGLAEETSLEVQGWLSQPAEVTPTLLAWAERYPELVKLESEKTLGGHVAYAITVTNPGRGRIKGVRYLSSRKQVPHTFNSLAQPNGQIGVAMLRRHR